jgi:hypothetical protein
MRHLLNSLALLILGCIIVPPLLAQEIQPQGGAERSTWFMYFGDHPVSRRWALHLEGQYRREGIGQRWEEFVARPGVDRDFGHGFSSMLAYAYFRHYQYEDASFSNSELSGVQPEHRISEDISFQHKISGGGKEAATFTHRFRAEQRFEGESIQGVGTVSWRFAERAQYRLTMDIPLRWEPRRSRPNYVSVYNEVFARFGPHAAGRTLDQNRTYGAVGWNLSKTEQFEIGYLFQYLPVPNETYREQSHALQLTVNSSAPFHPGIHKRRKKADPPP